MLNFYFEDVIKDGKKQYENGLPSDGDVSLLASKRPVFTVARYVCKITVLPPKSCMSFAGKRLAL